MKRNHLKLLDLDSFSNNAKKCLSPVQKKISLYYINSNIKAIKSSIKIFNKTNPSKKYKNLEIIETNSRFKKYMDKYYEYKKYFNEKDKHKIKKKTKSTIDLIVDSYIKKGYKIPNLQNNIFHTNPLNDAGKRIQKYFNEYIRNKKRPVTIQEKNFYYLYKLQDCIKAQKYKDEKNLQMILNISNYNSTNTKEINYLNNNYNNGNLFLKKYFNNINNIKKPCLSDRENIQENNLDISNISNIDNKEKNKNNVYDYEQDENFKKLNEYEQKNIRQLIKDREENKKYKTFIEKVLKDKKYFNTIDNDNIELDKKEENKNINSNKNNNKKFLKLKLNNNTRNNYNKLDGDNTNSSENTGNLNENERGTEKFNFRKKLSTLVNPYKMSNIRLFNYPQKKNSIRNNKNTTSSKKKESDINLDKKASFSISQEDYEEQIKIRRRGNTVRKTEILPGNKFLKKYNFSSKNLISNNKMPKLMKERSLNFLFKKIKTGEIPDKKTLNEYKKYFFINKNMSENDLNEFINRDYEPQDFYNLVNSVDAKIKSADLENKLKKKYEKIGRYEEKKNLFDEEKKQDKFISHLLQNYILAKFGKYNLYQFQK